MSALPSDSNPIADFPRPSVFSKRIDHAGDLVPGGTWISDSRKEALFGYRVAMTNAAGLDFDSYLSGARIAYGLFAKLEISTSAFHTHRFHKQALLLANELHE
jgi:hypothetical protein